MHPSEEAPLQEIARLKQRVRELEAQLAQNSPSSVSPATFPHPSHAWIRLSLETAGVGLWFNDIVRQTIYFDEIARNHYGFEQSFVSLNNFVARIHPDDLGRFRKEVSYAVDKKGADRYSVQFRVLHPNGEIHWLETEAHVEYEGEGERRVSVCAYGISQDITARVQTQLELVESERRFRQLAECIPESFWISDAEDNKILYISPAYEKIWGRSSSGVYQSSQNFFETVHPEDVGLVKQAFNDMLGGLFTSTDFRILRPDGEMRWIRAEGFPIFDHEGRLTRTAGIAADITKNKNDEKALKDRESFLRSLINSDPGYIVTFDLDGYFQFSNRRWPGQSNEEFHKTNVIDLVLAEDREKCWAAFQQSIETQSVVRIEQIGRVPGGEYHWLEITYSPIIVDGVVTQVTAFVNDIHERKQAEVLIHQLSQRNSEAVRIAHLGYWEYHIAGSKFTLSKEFKELLKRDTTDDCDQSLHGQDIVQAYVHPASLSEARDAFQKLMSNPDPSEEVVVEVRMRRDDGQEFWTRNWLTMSPDRMSILGVSQDITTLKQTQIQLQELNETLEKRVKERTDQVEDLYNNAPCGYHSLDIHGVFVRVNQTELEWLGYSREEMIGKMNIRDILTPEGVRTFENSYPNFIKTGFVHNIEYDYIRKDGSSFPVALNASAIYAPDGAYLMNRATIFDITAQRKVEAELRRQQTELTAANLALAKASRLKDEFLASMSHELRTPLTGVLGLSEALQSGVYGPLTPKQSNTLRTIEESGRHLLNLINDILDLSKIEAGMMDIQLAPVSANDVCQASLRMVKQMAANKRQSVSYFADPPDLALISDQRRLKQIMVNLLSNAVKFTPEGGKLGLEVRANPQQQIVEFSVWDQGIGITEEDLSRLFQPFVQLDSSLSRSFSGTGLGLSLVRSLTDLLGGSVTVESTPGQGSRFTCAFPWLAVAESAGAFAHPISVTTTVSGKALVIDDSPIIAEQLRSHLVSLGFQQIVIHSRAQGVLERVRQVRPEVILLDILLPDGSGWEVLKELKATPEICDIPVIIVSVVDDRGSALQLGAAEHLLKPVALVDLQMALQQVKNAALSPHNPVMIIARQAQRRSVLIAEDNEINILVTTDYLAALGYTTLVAHNGGEAVALAQSAKPDLILMDIQMPGMDGLEAMRQIRALPDSRVAGCPIIALTALAMPGDRERCLAAGAQEYLSKPVRLDVLSQVIQTILPRPAAAPDSQIDG